MMSHAVLSRCSVSARAVDLRHGYDNHAIWSDAGKSQSAVKSNDLSEPA
jgi:hypothetical protein